MEQAEGILAEQLERIENPDRRARFAFVMRALSPDPAVRDAFFRDLADARNREREAWVVAGLRYLHHPLRAPGAEPYLRPTLDLLEEIQRTGDIFFPTSWLEASLGGHQSARAAAVVRQFLEDRDDLPYQLRLKVHQAADGLFRAASILDTGAEP